MAKIEELRVTVWYLHFIHKPVDSWSRKALGEASQINSCEKVHKLAPGWSGDCRSNWYSVFNFTGLPPELRGATAQEITLKILTSATIFTTIAFTVVYHNCIQT